MFRESLKLGNFKKVYPLALLSTLFLFLGGFCLFRGNASDIETIVSVVGFFCSLSVFLYLYAAQLQVIGNELTAELQEEEPASVKEILQNWKSYALPTAEVLLVGAAMYQLIIPLIGSIAGGIFQVNIGGVDFNILTFLLNIMLIVWLMFGLAEINTIGVGFKDTFSYTVNFVFTNFRKVVLFMVVYIIFAYLVMLLAYATMGSLVWLPVRLLVTAYVIGFLNVYAANLFIDNVSDEDFVEPDEEETEEE